MSGVNDLRAMIPEFARLEAACFAVPWSAQMLTESLESGLYIFTFVKQDDVLAGYACGLIAGDQGEIDRICVLPEFRRRGIGVRLLTELKTAFIAAGCGSMFLEVRASNAAARAMYEKFGFRETGRRKNYYPDDDAVLYGTVL